MKDIICIEDTPWFSKMTKANQTNVKEYLVSTFSTQLCQNTSGNAYIDMQISSNLLMVQAKDYATKMGFISRTRTLAELTRDAFPSASKPRGLRVMVIEDTVNSLGPGEYDGYSERPDQTSAIIDLYEERVGQGDLILKYHPEPYGDVGSGRRHLLRNIRTS